MPIESSETEGRGEKRGRRRVVCPGSIVVDVIVGVPHLPRPGETVTGDSRGCQLRAGGKAANQAVAAARAGAGDATVFHGCVGQDAMAETALAHLRAAGVTLLVPQLADANTALAAISVDPAGNNQIAVGADANMRVQASALRELPLTADDILLLQLEIPLKTTRELLEYASEVGCTVVLNAAPAQATIRKEDLECVSVLVVNEVEAEALVEILGLSPPDQHSESSSPPAQPEAALKAGYVLYSALADTIVCVSIGKEGAALFANGLLTRCSSLDVNAVDTVGAGDAFLGAFVEGMRTGLPYETCLRHGCVAGSLACEQVGAQEGLPSKSTIMARIEEVSVSVQEAKETIKSSST